MLKAGATLIVCLMSLAGYAQRFVPSVSKYISDSAETIAFKDVKIIDGTGNPSKEHQTVIINKGIIIKIGTVQDVEIPAGASIINCSGKTLIPGMVMLHEHFYYTMAMDNYFIVDDAMNLLEQLGVMNVPA